MKGQSMRILRTILCCILNCTLLLGLAGTSAIAQDHVVYDGFDGPGQGKHIVLISGDEEYRSEEMLPQLGKILAKHHGFKCTVLFAIGEDGTIDPVRRDNIPGLETLKTADLMIVFTRFRDLPDSQMKHFVDYVNSGKPIIGCRTATHAFKIDGESKYAEYSFRSKEWDGGFGRQVLGETWINHHGHHGKESTRGIIAPGMQAHPIVTGIQDGDIWGPTDVYGVNLPLPGDSQPIVLGQVLEGMNADDKPVVGKKNDPMMPIAWTRSFTGKSGNTSRVFTTTLGCAEDLESEGVRRLLVNASYWGLTMEDQIPAKAKVDIVGDYEAHPFGFGKFTKNVRPADLKMK
jgi:hypothetical protein